MINSRFLAASFTGLVLVGSAAAQAAPYFEKQSSFFVCDNSNCDREEPEQTSAEIVAASADGMHLIYSDAPASRVGFIGIADPASPEALGSFELSAGSSPTSVAVAGDHLLVAVDTSDGDFVNPSGELRVYSVSSCVDTNPISCESPVIIALGGQPDSIAISPDGAFAAIAIENQRNEDGCFADIDTPLPQYDGDDDACEANGGYYGILPQGPAGQLDVIELAGLPDTWTVSAVGLTGGGLAGLHEPMDPEVEFVSVNAENKAVVSLQENNGYAIVDLPTLSVDGYLDAGEVDLLDVDLTDERPNLISLSQDASKYREPDAVAWIGDSMYFASANEGDMRGGGRGFTLFDSTDGSVVFESYESSDYLQVMHGHYNDRRSDAKGNEPEAVLFAEFADQDLLFVGAERSNTVAVYNLEDLEDESSWTPMQVLNSGVGPEGLLAIPGRNLFVVANENDEDIRSLVVIWEMIDGEAPEYPTIASGMVAEADGPAGVLPAREGFARPIAWGALSGLAADSAEAGRLFSIHDSFYRQSRIFTVDASSHPAMIDGEIVLLRNGSRVNYDLEGIAQAADGTFWLASEGAGNAPNPTTANLLVHVDADGTVLEEVALPAEVAARQKSNGYEGVAIEGEGSEERVYVAFQREWANDPVGLVRIGEYRPHTGKWKFYWYPLDAVESPAGGWIGLSEITALGGRAFLIIERDNQAGRDARVKRIYHFDLDEGRTPQQSGNKGNGNGQAFPYVNKTLVYDLMEDYEGLNGWVPEKVEGLTVDADGEVFVVTDNDGVNGSTGETHFLSIGFIDNLLP